MQVNASTDGRAAAKKKIIEVTVPTARPVTIRLPAPGQLCPWSGLSRAKLNEVCLPTPANNFNPPVLSYVIKQKPHKKTGIRLVDFESLCAFIHRHKTQVREVAA